MRSSLTLGGLAVLSAAFLIALIILAGTVRAANPSRSPSIGDAAPPIVLKCI